MVVRNYTRFVPLLFQSRDVQSQDFWVLIVRGTFRIVSYGGLIIDPEQHPIVMSDVFHGDPRTSSLRMESDIVPFKPRTDIHINATARAPGGREATDWLVRAQIGAIDKTLRVTGPRRWIKEGGEYRLTEPEPCVEVPIRYEHAFGGVWKNNWGDSEVFQENPVGVGYLKQGEQPTEDEIPAPQIEAPEDPIRELGRTHQPQGFGPINRSWLPRRTLAGTYDERWKAERWPELPFDFSYDYCNSGHPDLICSGYLKGDEAIHLDGVQEAPIRFHLPGCGIDLLIKQMFGAFRRFEPPIDTLAVDIPEERIHITWRARVPRLARIRAFEIREKMLEMRP